MSNPQIVIVEEYTEALGIFGDKVKTMKYPGMIILHDTGALVFDLTDMDIMFNRFMAALAKQKFTKNK